MKNIQKYRFIVQLLCIPLFIVGIFTQFKITMLLVMVLAFFAGVYYCGWMCPYGTLQELAGKLGNKLGIKKRKMPNFIQKYLGYLRYIIFGIFTLFTFNILFTIISFDPRVNTLLLISGTVVSISAIVVLISFLLLSLFFDRPFCNYLCIEGAKFGLISLLRPVTIIRNEDSCVNCKKCDNVCPMQVEVSTIEQLHSPSCINCFECVSACPIKDTLTYGPVSLTSRLKKYYIQMIALAAIIGLAFLAYTMASNQEMDTINETPAVTNSETSTQSTNSQGEQKNGRHKNSQSESNTNESNQTVDTTVVDTDESNKTTSSTSTTTSDVIDSNASNNDATGIKDGVYTGIGRGFRGNMTVEVTISNETITKVAVIDHVDDNKWFNFAYDTISSSMVKEQTVDVDTVSGATYSAKGIIEGANAALESARNN